MVAPLDCAKPVENILHTYINVHPNVMLLTNICNIINWIKSPHHSSSRGAVDKKRPPSFIFMP